MMKGHYHDADTMVESSLAKLQEQYSVQLFGCVFCDFI